MNNNCKLHLVVVPLIGQIIMNTLFLWLCNSLSSTSTIPTKLNLSFTFFKLFVDKEKVELIFD